MNEVQQVKDFFSSRQVLLSLEWLESCINWCKEENLPPNYTIKDLQVKVYEQWLLLDLRVVELAILPPDIEKKKEYVLQGTYCLQMMEVVDISKPKLWQLQRIRNNMVKNTDVAKDFGKRVLQLTLTDGVQYVNAMEFKPIPCLNINLSPGTKISIIGPIKVRRGRLMLENRHVKLLGGEAEELAIPNHPENILARALNLPLNPNPTPIEEKLLEVNDDTINHNEGTASFTRTQNHQNTNNMGNNLYPTNQHINAVPNNQLSNQSITNCPTVTSSRQTALKPQNINYFNDDDHMKTDEEIDELLELERELQQNQQTKRTVVQPKSGTPDLFEDMDDDWDLEKIEKIESEVQNKGKETVKQVNKCDTKMLKEKTDLVPVELQMDDDIFQNIDLDNVNESILNRPCSSQKPNVITLEKLLKKKNEVYFGKFKVKVKFVEVVEKLSIKEEDFKLAIKIKDESTEAIVKVHTDVVSDFAGYCPASLMTLKMSIINKDQDATQKFILALQRLKDKLIQLDGLVEIQISREETLPILVGVL